MKTETVMRLGLAGWVGMSLLRPGAAAASGTQATGDEIRSEVSGRVDAFVERQMHSRGTPGASVAIVRGGEVIHLAGYGVADATGRSVTPDTAFLIGSVSKPFTAIAIFQLVANGRLELDEPVRPYLENIVGSPAAAFDGITIDHLLTHTSGLSNALGLPGTERISTAPDTLNTRIRDLVAHHERHRQPGESYEYSNANYIVLASVIEQITGERFADVIRERVFDPLGMTSSFASNADPRAAALATGYQSWFGRWLPSRLPYDAAAAANGYMGSTARDLARFMSAELDGSPALPLTVSDVAARPPNPTGWDIPLERGVNRGWFIDEVAGFRTVSHAGSLGDFTSHVILVPGADGLGIAVATNASAFVAAGHRGQYELSLGLLDLMLNREPHVDAPSLLGTVVAPAASWGLALVVLISAARHVRRIRRGTVGRTRRRRHLLRELAPSTAYLGLAGLLLGAAPAMAGTPLGAAQVFYPDVSYGLAATGYLAAAWGLARAALGLGALRTSRAAVASAPVAQRAGAQ